jgi:tight adherence protein B
MGAMNLLAALTFGLACALLCWATIAVAISLLGRYRTRFTADTEVQLGALFLFVDPSRLFALNAGAALIIGIGAWMASGVVLIGFGFALSCALLPRITLAWLQQRRLHAIEQQLPDALQIIAGGLRAGVSLPLALQQLVREGQPPISQEFDLLLREHRLGVALDEALEHLAQRLPLQTLTLVVAAMRIANETGGSLAEALERAALSVRSQLAMAGKIRALTAQGKLQAIVVGLLPLSLLAILDRMEPQAMALLWNTPMGWITLGAIITLELLGVLTIRRVVAIDI